MYTFSLPVIDKLLTVTLKKEKESMLIESAFHFSTTFVFFFINPFAPSFMSSLTKRTNVKVFIIFIIQSHISRLYNMTMR